MWTVIGRHTYQFIEDFEELFESEDDSVSRPIRPSQARNMKKSRQLKKPKSLARARMRSYTTTQ
jgi:hypothetical protein